MESITTTIERQWLAEIVAGTKRIEYRKVKPYWTERLRKVGRPLRLVLRNGMPPPIPVVTVRIDHRRTASSFCWRLLSVLALIVAVGW